jgi:uncharacterized protein
MVQVPVDLAVALPVDRLDELCQRWKIEELAVFGSVVRPDFTAESDVDVLVTFAPDAPWSLFDLVHLHDELEGLFERKVDLVEETAIRNPLRKQEILRSKQTLYAA